MQCSDGLRRCMFTAFVFFLMIRQHPSSPLFPYPPLFRSDLGGRDGIVDEAVDDAAGIGDAIDRQRVGGGTDQQAEEQQERSEEHTSELQSRLHLVCRLLLEKKKGEFLIHLDCKARVLAAR